jgi:hypothetical protein
MLTRPTRARAKSEKRTCNPSRQSRGAPFALRRRHTHPLCGAASDCVAAHGLAVHYGAQGRSSRQPSFLLAELLRRHPGAVEARRGRRGARHIVHRIVYRCSWGPSSGGLRRERPHPPLLSAGVVDTRRRAQGSGPSVVGRTASLLAVILAVVTWSERE